MVIITFCPTTVNELTPEENQREQYRELYRFLGKVRVSTDPLVLVAFFDALTGRMHFWKVSGE